MTLASKAALWLVVVSLAFAADARATCFCIGDVDGDENVDFTDLLQVLADWGPCVGECPADLDRDAVVGFSDLLMVLNNWGLCLFQYGEPRADAEAEQIGLESLGVAGPLQLPDDVYERFLRDVAAIRVFEAGLAQEIHAPAWLPDRLIIKRNPDGSQEELGALNCFYRADERHLFGDWLLLTFPRPVNVPAMAAIYVATEDVDIAEPDYVVGGENFWVPSNADDDSWRWDVDDGFTDCTDGCDCHRRYVFEVDGAGRVELVDFREEGPPYCEF